MDIADVEQLIDIFRDAQVSELMISTGTPQSTIKLRKPISAPRTQTACSCRETSGVTEAVSVSAADKTSTVGIPIKAQVVGIFHMVNSAATIDAPIKAGQVVGSIESMKLMNDVKAECNGILTEVLVEDGMPVEYGQTLFILNPAS